MATALSASEVLQMAATNPDDAVRVLQQKLSSTGRIAGHALGMTSAEIQHIASKGIPATVAAVLFFGVGAVVAMRYAPDRWTATVRRFGR